MEANKRIALEVLKGKRGAHRDIVLLNAGCAMYAANKASSIKEGVAQAVTSIIPARHLKN